MEKEIDRDLQRKRKEKDSDRPIIDDIKARDIIELGLYRELIELHPPTQEIIKKRKLVI